MTTTAELMDTLPGRKTAAAAPVEGYPAMRAPWFGNVAIAAGLFAVPALMGLGLLAEGRIQKRFFDPAATSSISASPDPVGHTRLRLNRI
ncbi:MAG: hypothetical protein AB7F96_11650 [Beijerinckiaceae bacterium]